MEETHSADITIVPIDRHIVPISLEDFVRFVEGKKFYAQPPYDKHYVEIRPHIRYQPPSSCLEYLVAAFSSLPEKDAYKTYLAIQKGEKLLYSAKHPLNVIQQFRLAYIRDIFLSVLEAALKQKEALALLVSSHDATGKRIRDAVFPILKSDEQICRDISTQVLQNDYEAMLDAVSLAYNLRDEDIRQQMLREISDYVSRQNLGKSDSRFFDVARAAASLVEYGTVIAAALHIAHQEHTD